MGRAATWPRDAKGALLFHILAPTVEDATGKPGKAMLTLDASSATIALDPAFLATAAYPITVDPTTLLGEGPISETTAYTYDQLSRLTQVVITGGTTTTYGYDPVGNRLSMNRGAVTNYAYDRADRITTAGSTSYSVNANGNLTARGSDGFAYDQANRLKQATVGSTTVSYAWDGDGRRASQTVGSTTTRWVYDVNRGLPVNLEDGTRKYVWGLGLAYAVEGTNLDIYHADGLSSVRAISDRAGAVTQLYQTVECGRSRDHRPRRHYQGGDRSRSSRGWVSPGRGGKLLQRVPGSCEVVGFGQHRPPRHHRHREPPTDDVLDPIGELRQARPIRALGMAPSPRPFFAVVA